LADLRFVAPPPASAYPLSLHDALPISGSLTRAGRGLGSLRSLGVRRLRIGNLRGLGPHLPRLRIDASLVGEREARLGATVLGIRSEEHTSELQSRFDLVCRLLLEKKKQ